MTRKSDIEVNTLTSGYAHLAGLESLRQQQREQTLEWVSLNALSTLRSSWRKAKLVNHGLQQCSGRSSQLPCHDRYQLVAMVSRFFGLHDQARSARDYP